jgi:ketosteroid isomerase-like protein
MGYSLGSRAFWSYAVVVTFLVDPTISALAQAPVTASRSSASADIGGIRTAAEQFLRVFDDLDWEPFRASWASEPTVFFPFTDTPGRVAGKAAVEARWRQFFEEARRGPGPPYLNLKPLDLRVDRYGDVGVVTLMLELDIGGRKLPLQRRTLIFIREHGAWKLAHMHASGATQP